jgi:hypothetical protein
VNIESDGRRKRFAKPLEQQVSVDEKAKGKKEGRRLPR